MEHGEPPLAGVRILAVEQVVAMPYATQLLTRLGADVVKIEHSVDGDTGWHPYPLIGDHDGRLVGAADVPRNLHKHSIGLDLKSGEGKELFLELPAGFDVVADNMCTGTTTRPEAAHELRGLGVPAAPCHGPADILADPHVSQRGMVVRHTAPARRETDSFLGNPIKFSAARGEHLGAQMAGIGRADIRGAHVVAEHHPDRALGCVGAATPDCATACRIHKA